MGGGAMEGNVLVNKVTVEEDEKPSLVVNRRPAIKLAQTPTIAVCMPIGDKHDETEFTCPDCKTVWRQSGIRAHGLVPIQWATNHMQIVPPLNVSMTYMFEFGKLAAEAREVLTHNALKTGCKYIFYWDDDVLLPPLALYNMYNFLASHENVGAVTGVYCTREYHPEPILYKDHGQGPYWGFVAGDHAEPEEIFSCGGGCLLVRTDAIKKMKPPYWADAQELLDESDDGPAGKIVWGHDVRFCVKLRTEAEMPLYMMGDVLCGHWDVSKSQVFTLPADSPPIRRWRHLNWKSYWDDVWGGRRIAEAPKYPEVYDWILGRNANEASLADLGCGVGLLLQKFLREGLNKDIYAIGYDASPQALKFAEQLMLPVSELDLRNLQAEHLEGRDLVTCTFVLEWLDDAVRDRILTLCKGKRFVCAVDPKEANRLSFNKLETLLRKYFNNVFIEKVGKFICAECDNYG